MTCAEDWAAPLRSGAAAIIVVLLLHPIPCNSATKPVSTASAAAGSNPSSPVRAWPADSLYNADAPLQTSDGRTTSFAATGGRTRIVTMFYSNCPMACPLTIDTLRNIDSALSTAQRAKLDVLLLSMDPKRDTPAALGELASKRRIADPRWTLARASSLSNTRKLAAVLGIQYRALDNGDFDHASVLILLDASGRVLARSRKLGTPEPEFLRAVQAAVDGDATPP